MNHNDAGLIDIHSHFLPGLDDGPENIDQCMETARRYREIGVDGVIATPHYIQGTRWAPARETIHAVIRGVEETLAGAGIDLHIFPGMEITLTDTLCRNFDPSELLALGGTSCFLVECPLNASLDDPAVKGLQNLLAQEGSIFVLAHPERCRAFQENPEHVHSLVSEGMLAQVNIGSVLGLEGKKARDTALGFLQNGLVHFLASDSHARGNRMPPDPGQLEQLNKLLGEDIVYTALSDNPRRMLAGREVKPIRLDAAAPFNTGFLPALNRLAESFRSIFRGN